MGTKYTRRKKSGIPAKGPAQNSRPPAAPQQASADPIDGAIFEMMETLNKLTPDERTAALNRVVKNLAIINFEAAENSRKETDRSREILSNFIGYNPIADKYIKEYVEQSQSKKA